MVEGLSEMRPRFRRQIPSETNVLHAVLPGGQPSGLVRAAPARARSLSQHHLERPPHIKATLTEGQHEVLQHCPTIQVHNPERGLRSCSGVAEAPCTALPQHGHHCAHGQVTWQA